MALMFQCFIKVLMSEGFIKALMFQCFIKVLMSQGFVKADVSVLH